MELYWQRVRRFFASGCWVWNKLPRATVTVPGYHSSCSVWTMLSETWLDFWVVLCRVRSWTQVTHMGFFQLQCPTLLQRYDGMITNFTNFYKKCIKMCVKNWKFPQLEIWCCWSKGMNPLRSKRVHLWGRWKHCEG